MPNCAVATCKNNNKKTKGSDVRYFRFPQNDDLSKQWVNACRRQEKINLKNARICSIHFDESSFQISLRHKLLQYNPTNSRILKADALPVLHLLGSSLVTRMTSDGQPQELKREQEKLIADLLTKSDLESQASTSGGYPDNVAHTVIESTGTYVAEGGEFRAKTNSLEKENEAFQKQIDTVKTETYQNVLEDMFTPGQINKLLKSENKNILWAPEGIASMVCLRIVSPKEYRTYNGEEGSSDEGIIESAPTEKTDNEQEDLDQKNFDKTFNNDVMDLHAVKKETDNVNEAEELNYSNECTVKSEISIEQEELHIKHEEDQEDNLNEKTRIPGKQLMFHQCPECPYRTIYKHHLKSHSIRHKIPDEVVLYNCEKCSFKTSRTHTLNAHEEIHKSEQEKLKKKIHQCPECPYKSIYKHHLKSHLIRHKQPDEVVWYSCQKCPFKTSRKHTLNAHEEIHKSTQERLKTKIHQCPECPYKTSLKNNLKNHAEIHNSDHLILKCSNCSYETSRPINFKRHQIRHKTNIQWLNCFECSFKTHQPSLLRKHVLAHKSDAFKCTKCSYNSRTKHQLTKHQIKHESIDKWHSCPLCTYKSYDKSNLKAHCRLRHSIDPKNPEQIEIYTCTECSYESGCKRTLKTHQLIHDQMRWFQCSECVYKTPYKTNLKHHQVRHQSENKEDWHRCADEIHWFECTPCNYKTMRKSDLKQHQLTHKEAHEIEWFYCYECSFKTKCKRYLVTHISKHKKEIDKGYL